MDAASSDSDRDGASTKSGGDEPRRRRRRRRRAPSEPPPPEPVEGRIDEPLPGPEPEIFEADVVREDMDADAQKVIRRLRRYGHRAYLVGGGVRDLLLRVRPKDFDIATSARPNEVRALFRNCRVIGRRFRLAHVLFGGGKIIEVATFRRDPNEGDAPSDDDDVLIRHDNVFGEPHEDAKRRDFTINGLFYDSEDHTVIDYVGGMADVRARLVRTIGPPDLRFREDPVRILRAIKFSARLDLGIHPDVYDAMVAQREELARAARPRLLEELLRLLRGGAAHRSYWLMWETGVLSVLLPSLAMYLDDDAPDARLLWARLGAIDTLVRAGARPDDSVLLGALLYGPVQEVMRDAKDSLGAYEDFMGDVLTTFAVPRRIKERIRSIMQAQRRMASGRLGALPRREHFGDAATLFAIECDARGVRRPEWLDKRRRDDEDDEGRPRRRRRRRR